MEWTVAIGIDTHKREHVAVALDQLGQELGRLRLEASGAGYLRLWEWACELGLPAFALEGTGSYGAGLARFLAAVGAVVYECERPARRERRRGKNDPRDALLAARRLLAGEEGLSALRGGGRRESLRVLLIERRSAEKARTDALNQLHGLVVTAPERLRSRLRSLSDEHLARAAAALRARSGDGEEAVLVDVLRRLGRRALALGRELLEIERRLLALLRALAPDLLAECGVGAFCAGVPLATTSWAGGCARRRPSPHLRGRARSTPPAAASSVIGSIAAATGS